MPRWFSVPELLLAGSALLAAVAYAPPARAQEPPEALTVPATAQPAGTDPDPLFFYFEGNNRALSGDYRGAIRYYRHALALDSSQVAIPLAMARCYAANEQYDSTLVWADAARRLDPGQAESYRLAGTASLRLRRTGDAIRALQQAVSLDTLDSGSFTNLLFLLESTRRYEDALALIARAPRELREAPALRVRRARLLVQTSRPSEAVTELVSVLRAQPATPEAEMVLALALSRGPESIPDAPAVEALLRDQPLCDQTRTALARLYLSARRYDEAQAHLEILSAHEPENARVQRDIGVLLFRKGEFDAARERFRALDEASHGDAEARRWLCRIAVVQNRPEEAIRLSDSVAADLPDDSDALLCRASALLALRRTEDALAAARAVLRADSTNREAGLLASAVLDDLERSGEAVALLKPIVSEYPADRNVLFAYGAVLERAGQVDSSLAVFDRLLRDHPDDDEALNHAGYICIDRAVRVDEGVARVRRALDLDPDNGAYLDSYGWGLFRQGRKLEALEWLVRAAERSPQEPEIRLHEGQVYESLGRQGEAENAYREALRLRPGDAGIQRRLEAAGRRPEAPPVSQTPASK